MTKKPEDDSAEESASAAIHISVSQQRNMSGVSSISQSPYINVRFDVVMAVTMGNAVSGM
jgi:hypothetical protein